MELFIAFPSHFANFFLFFEAKFDKTVNSHSVVLNRKPLRCTLFLTGYTSDKKASFLDK